MRHGWILLGLMACAAAMLLIAAKLQRSASVRSDPTTTTRSATRLATTTRPASRPVKIDEVDQFFAEGIIPRLKIEIGPKELEALRRDARAYVPATVREIDPGKPDRIYARVGIHLKARWGSFRGVDDRPAMTVSFDRFVVGQRFHGLPKISLNNSVQDGTFLHETVGRQLYRAAGVPAARASHARVWLNGKDQGFFVLLEGIDRGFLKKNFGDGNGTLYEGNLQELDQPLQATVLPVSRPFVPTTLGTTRPSRDTPEMKKLEAAARAKAQAELAKLWAAINERDPAVRRQKLEQMVDVDQFLSYMAMESLIAHWDGYCQNRNNYRILLNSRTGKFVLIPHGMDQIFAQSDFPIFMGAGALARVILEYPEYRERYVERVADLRRKVLEPEFTNKMVDRITAKTIPALAEISRDLGKQHEQQAADLKRRIADRAQALDRQLAAIPKPLKFDSTGVASLGGWQLNQAGGNSSMDRVKDGDKQCLRIRSGAGGCVASLRTTVMLPRGKYVFEGMARSIKAPPADGDFSGIGLRISGGTRTGKLPADSAWQKIEYALDIAEPSREVVLVCEARIKGGEAWFEEGSLKLRRQ